jgi:hypothetical protein
MTQQQFLNLLFDRGQQTCFAPDAKGVTIKPTPGPKDVFFSINAISHDMDAEPTESWHDVSKPRRADCNVICFRNFLIELDNMPLVQQIDYVRSKVPVSAITFSGKKSYHFIISLETPLYDLEDYMKFSHGLMRLLPEADKATKNPSRLSRLPGVVRPDTGLLQELVYLGTRIASKDLPEFPPSPHTTERPVGKTVYYVTQQLLEAQKMGVDNFIAAHFSGRNQFFYWLGRRCSELNHTRDEKKTTVERFYDRLENKKGFSIREAFLAARVKF